MDVPVGTKMFGTWTSEEWREETEGMDPWEKPFPTITKGGVWLKFPSGREVHIKVEHLHWIRTFNGDRAFEFSPSDDEELQRLILAMGVSTVVASAARRAIERWIDEHGLLTQA